MDKSGIQLSLTVAPAEQFQPAPMLNIQGDTPEQFVLYLTEAAKLVELAPFFQSLDHSASKVAISQVQRVLDPTATPVVEAATPAPVFAAKPPAATEAETCPQCGSGRLVEKQRRDKKGSFMGCDSYPACNYIKRDR